MKSLVYTIILLLLSFSGLSAQWSTDPTQNTPVCIAANAQYGPVSVSDSAGGVIFVWMDTRLSTNENLYAQRTDGSGMILWATDGIRVTSRSSPQMGQKVVTDQAFGAIVVWEDKAGGPFESDLIAQRLDASGHFLWSDTGKVVIMAPGFQGGLSLLSDGKGGAFIFWHDSKAGANMDLFGQRIDPNGNLLWNPAGVLIAGGPGHQWRPLVVSDSAGGAIVSWEDSRGGNFDIFAQRIDSAGAIQWGVNGVPVCAAPEDQDFATMTTDGKGGAIIMWRDRRNANQFDVYAQRILSNGLPAWMPDGVGIYVGQYDQYSPLIASDGKGGAFVHWVGEDAARNPFIYLDRIDSLGTKQWSTTGLRLCSLTVEDLDNLTEDGTGGAIVSWSDNRMSLLDHNIYAQRITASGMFLWPADGRIISNAPNSQTNSTLIADNTGGAFIAWVDKRTDAGDIFAARIQPGGALLPVEFLSFSAVRTGSGVELGWRTLHEKENSGFEIQRREAEIPAQAWQSIGFVPGRNNDLLQEAYSFRDDSPTQGSCSYRLRQVNYDGSESYSPIVSVSAGLISTPKIHSVFPSPVASEATIEFSLPSSAFVSLDVFDVLGRTQQHLISDVMTSGRHAFRWAGIRLSPGMYFLRMKSGTFVQTMLVFVGRPY